MSEWIGARDILHTRDESLFDKNAAPLTRDSARPVGGWAQTQKPEPPRPARTARFPGSPSTVVTASDAATQRPPRQYVIQGKPAGNRVVWPENTSAKGMESITIPVHEGMLDGKPNKQEEPKAWTEPVAAPVLLPDADEYEDAADDAPEQSGQSENVVLAVYGIEPSVPPSSECVVAIEAREAIERIAELTERIAALEERIAAFVAAESAKTEESPIIKRAQEGQDNIEE